MTLAVILDLWPWETTGICRHLVCICCENFIRIRKELTAQQCMKLLIEKLLTLVFLTWSQNRQFWCNSCRSYIKRCRIGHSNRCKKSRKSRYNITGVITILNFLVFQWPWREFLTFDLLKRKAYAEAACAYCVKISWKCDKNCARYRHNRRTDKHTNKQTNKQTNKMTDQHTWQNLFCQVMKQSLKELGLGKIK